MKRALMFLTIIAMMINQESGMANTLTPVAVQMRPAMKNVQAHGKPKLRLKSSLVILPPNPEEIVIDDDLVLARNRNRIELVEDEQEELSDYIKLRLALSRMKALEKYNKVWG